MPKSKLFLQVKNGVIVNADDVYTKTVYADKIKKSPTWVSKLIEKGELQAVKINSLELVCEHSKLIKL